MPCYDSLVSFCPEVDSAAGVFYVLWSWQNSPDEPVKMWTCLLFFSCLPAQRIPSTYQKKHTWQDEEMFRSQVQSQHKAE